MDRWLSVSSYICIYRAHYSTQQLIITLSSIWHVTVRLLGVRGGGGGTFPTFNCQLLLTLALNWNFVK